MWPREPPRSPLPSSCVRIAHACVVPLLCRRYIEYETKLEELRRYRKKVHGIKGGCGGGGTRHNSAAAAACACGSDGWSCG